MLVTQSVCCDVFDGDVWLDKYCAKIFAIGIFLRILTGIDTRPAGLKPRPKRARWKPGRLRRLGHRHLAPPDRNPLRAGALDEPRASPSMIHAPSTPEEDERHAAWMVVLAVKTWSCGYRSPASECYPDDGPWLSGFATVRAVRRG
jgi:hypothetical protein